MTINIKLLTWEKLTAAGYPLVVFISHKGKPKQERIGYSLPEHFLSEEQLISRKHPDYDILEPIIKDIHRRSNKIILQKYTDVDKAMRELFKVDFSEVLFVEFGRELVKSMRVLAQKFATAHDKKRHDQLLGNVKAYENVLNQFEPFATTVTLKNLDYEVLMRFRNFNLGNKKGTIHLYLRTLRAIYNKGLLLYKLPDEKPFKGVFNGLSTKSFNSKKKYLDKSGIILCEGINDLTAKQKYLDLWLLQFYFAGADLIDVYFLKKKQIRRGRVIFERGKMEDPRPIDLKIHPKAMGIIKKYPSDDEWLFPWKKEKSEYENFRRTYQRGLIVMQERYQIDVLPDGSNMGVKVARHTFANLAKRLRIEEDIIRELMGHERNDVDNYYKDRFSEADRDNALFEVISSFECVRG